MDATVPGTAAASSGRETPLVRQARNFACPRRGSREHAADCFSQSTNDMLGGTPQTSVNAKKARSTGSKTEPFDGEGCVASAVSVSPPIRGLMWLGGMFRAAMERRFAVPRRQRAASPLEPLGLNRALIASRRNRYVQQVPGSARNVA